MPGLSGIQEFDPKQERTPHDIKIPSFQHVAYPPSPEIPKAQVLDLAPVTAEIMSIRISHCVRQFVKFQIHEI